MSSLGRITRKNSKYFLGLEKRHCDRKSVKSLRNANGVVIFDQHLILSELVNFCETLYNDNSDNSDTQSYKFDETLSFPNLNEEEKTERDKPITESECSKAISQLANNKSPGLDGFSAEFYKTFWQDLKELFIKCLNYSLTTNRLCDSQYKGVITLIPKPGKDCMNVSNYRPITLLNYRLCRFLPKLINADQNDFVKGRNIGDNIRLMFDIIDYANWKKVSVAVHSVDLRKAFDSLKWPFIFKMLNLYGFGRTIINWIKILYKKTKCRIINDNNLSCFFDVKRRVRQGDPLSPTIFVLCIEYLAEMLRQNKEYQGFKINSHFFKVSLFADDSVIYLNGNTSQFNYVFDILKYFGNKSGCQVNLNKSCAFYLGSSKGRNFRPFLSSGLSWPDSSIKYLGVNIPVNNFDELSLFEKNFANVIHDMQSILNLWSARGLTLLGKITILKTLIIPKIVYKASLLPIHLPEKFVKELNKLMFKFIWGSKWEKIGRSKLSCSIEEGGAKRIDIKQYFLALNLGILVNFSTKTIRLLGK